MPEDKFYNLKSLSLTKILSLNAQILDELRSRGVMRSANNPTGDLAEHLFCTAFNWVQESNSTKAFDATDFGGLKYQIKGRRLHNKSKSREISAIRDLSGFDYLAAVLFNHDYTVLRAALIPSIVIQNRTGFSKHTNSNKFILRDATWDIDGVVDVTAHLVAAQNSAAIGSEN